MTLIPKDQPVLSLETATPVCSVALWIPDGTVLEERAEGQGVHSELTFVFIDRLLKKAGISVDGLGAVLLSAGPGSYTGLRVGSSAVKGLLFQTEIPLYTFNTLAGIAIGTAERQEKILRTEEFRMEQSRPKDGRTDQSRTEDSQEEKSRTVESQGEMPKTGESRKKDSEPVTVDAVIDARRNHLYHQVWEVGEAGVKAGSGLQVRELDEVLKRWESGGLVAGTGTERLLRLAESRDVDTAGLHTFPGTGVISAISILHYVAEVGERSTELLQKVDPRRYEPDYFSGL